MDTNVKCDNVCDHYIVGQCEDEDANYVIVGLSPNADVEHCESVIILSGWDEVGALIDGLKAAAVQAFGGNPLDK